MPPDIYVASLARKRMAAGALCRDRAGRVLLVDPVYRDTWDLPGGAVEAEESPQAACRREVAEELGLDRPVGRVLALDWVPSRPERPEGLIVVYDGGVLAANDIEAIVVPVQPAAPTSKVRSDAAALALSTAWALTAHPHTSARVSPDSASRCAVKAASKPALICAYARPSVIKALSRGWEMARDACREPICAAT